jgi:ABC-2 type transport system ATP-binding protein
MNAVVEAHELSKWFGEVVAVNNLSLSIAPGITGLLGPNGAGKSTFMKLALGLHAPSRGDIRILGSSPRNNLDVLRRIGYCPETDNFYDNTTGFEFVYWLTRYRGLGPAPAKKAAEEACELVRMTDRMHDPIDEYSKGMRQRIKIAQSLAVQPELLFLDEPMSGLDPQGREEMYALIRQLGQAGLSVIVSSHILYEVERITNRVVLLYNGTILAQGEVREIRDLIDEHPHTVTVETEDVRGVSRYFVDEPSTMSIEFGEASLVLRTRDPNRCFERLNELALEGAVPIRSITCVDDDLQSVFDYLVHS